MTIIILSFLMFSCFAEAPAEKLEELMRRVQELQRKDATLDTAQKAAAEKVAGLAAQLEQKGKSVAEKKAALAQMSKAIAELQQKAAQSKADSDSSSATLKEAQEKLAAMQQDLEKETAEHKAIGVAHIDAKQEHHVVTAAYVEHAKTIGNIHKEVVTLPHHPAAASKTAHSPKSTRGKGSGHHVTKR